MKNTQVDRAPGTLQVWAEPFTPLRVPKLFDLHADPYERADITSNTYWDWEIDHGYLLVGAQALTAEFRHNARGRQAVPVIVSNFDEGGQVRDQSGRSQRFRHSERPGTIPDAPRCVWPKSVPPRIIRLAYDNHIASGMAKLKKNPQYLRRAKLIVLDGKGHKINARHIRLQHATLLHSGKDGGGGQVNRRATWYGSRQPAICIWPLMRDLDSSREEAFTARPTAQGAKIEPG